LDLVLPATRGDARRARLCVRSFAARFGGIGTLWLVVPDAEVGAFGWSEEFDFARVVPESELVGPIAPLHRLVALRDRRLAGWYQQQRIKLAAHRLVESDFYLTLDADVLCTRAVTAEEDLFRDGRALCVHHEMAHPAWYRTAGWILGLPALESEYGVTPVLLHAASVGDLVGCLEARGRDLGRWIGWSEYALYFTFLEGTGRLDALYERVDFGDWFGPCAWSAWLPGDPSFSVAGAFAPRERGWFSLISSRSRTPLATVEALVEPWLEAAAALGAEGPALGR
jgi:hypothetical protein